MPDLESPALAEWWNAKPPALLAAVRRQEELESWPATGPKADALAVRLGHALERAAPQSPLFDGPETAARLRVALAYMRAGRRLRCLHWLASERESLFEAVLAGENGAAPPAAALRASLADLRDGGLLPQLFPPARLDLVIKLLS